MARGRRSKPGKRSKTLDIASPTPEQMRDSFTVEPVHDKTASRALDLRGTAYRRRPMIDTLADQGLFSDSELKALRHYRHHADIADRSPVRDSLCLQRGGNGSGPTITTLNAIRLVSDVEAAAGSLCDILRAVVVYDRSPSQIAIDRAGAVEKSYTRKNRKGEMVSISELRPKHFALEMIKLDIRMAARRVEAELAA